MSLKPKKCRPTSTAFPIIDWHRPLPRRPIGAQVPTAYAPTGRNTVSTDGIGGAAPALILTPPSGAGDFIRRQQPTAVFRRHGALLVVGVGDGYLPLTPLFIHFRLLCTYGIAVGIIGIIIRYCPSRVFHLCYIIDRPSIELYP